VKTTQKALKILLITVGVIVGGIVLLSLAGLAGWFWDAHKVSKIAARFQPGMTIEEFVAVLPTSPFSANISVPERTQPCKTETGQILPPEHYALLWPDMPEGDTEGVKLSDEARQIPMRLPSMESLDKHLRDRRDWKILLQAWSAYLENVENPGPIPYLRRGTTYLALGDFEHAYLDLKTSCDLRLKEACAEIKTLPPEKITAFEAEQKHIAATAPACEPELHWYDLDAASLFREEATMPVSQPFKDEPFRLRMHGPGQTEQTPMQSISRKELVDLLTREYKGREWIVGFRIEGDLDKMRSYLFHFTVDREGKLKATTAIQVWDR
jgi:hypothetical protein